MSVAVKVKNMCIMLEMLRLKWAYRQEIRKVAGLAAGDDP
jgi:hypothetical protein